MKYTFQLLILTIFNFCLFGQVGEINRQLYGIHKNVSSGSYSFVRYHIGGPDYDVILNFDSSLGDIWELAFNTENKKFYTYGKASYNVPSVLLELDAMAATVTNLGNINVVAGISNHSSICTTDGLTFNQSTGELIGTVDVDCGSWRAYRVVKFNPNTFGSGTVSSTQIGLLSATSDLEFDAIAMASNNTLQGMDPDIPSNSLKFYSVSNVSNSIGQTSLSSSMINWSTYRGIAFNSSEDRMYCFAEQNGLRWLVSCAPSYGANSYSFQNVTQYNLTGFDIRGIVFGDESMASVNVNVPSDEYINYADDLDIEIFPNPSSSYVEIKCDEKIQIERILILDSSGKIVHSASFPEITARKVNLTHLSEGVYFVHVIFENGISKSIRVLRQEN